MPLPFLAAIPAFLGGAKGVIIAVAATAVITLVGLLYWQNKSLTSDLATSQANVATAQLALQEQGKAVVAATENAEQWRKAMAGMQKRMEELANVQRKATAETRRLNNIFARHDLTALAVAKPGLIERRVNSGADSVRRVLQRVTAGNNDESAGSKATPGKTGPAESPADRTGTR